MMPRPAFSFDFSGASGVVDPRITFTRASIGAHADRSGVLRYRPANTPRFWHNSDDGTSLGMLAEGAATNLLLWSEAFDNVAWTKTACTLAPNAVVSPDGLTAGETVTATGITATVAQTITSIDTRPIVFSVFAKAAVNAYVSLTLVADSGAPVTAWFNLVSGTVGSFVDGTTNLLFSGFSMRRWANNWYRCALTVTCVATISVTASIAPCFADLFAPAVGNSVSLWGANLALAGNSAPNSALSSYISTTTASVTRAADVCFMPYSAITPDQFGWLPDGGTFFLDFSVQAGVAASSAMICGFADTANSYMMMGFSLAVGGSTLTMQASSVGSGVVGASVSDTVPFAPETSIRAIFRYAWYASLDLCVMGRPLVKSSTAPSAGPVVPPGTFEWNCGPGGGTSIAGPPVMTKRFAHYSRRLTDAQMQQLTA
jgi:hypothetical protein